MKKDINGQKLTGGERAEWAGVYCKVETDMNGQKVMGGGRHEWAESSLQRKA